jgi:taurine dioxygenase
MVNIATLKPFASASQIKEVEYQHFVASPINGALGAELEGLDLSREIEVSAVKEIRTALIQHQVIVFRNQKLDPEQLINLGRHFGDLHRNPFVKGLDHFPEVIEIRSEENHEKQFTGLWHSDISWSSRPSLGSLLYAVHVPTFGGDTLFSNMYEAFTSLSSGMQKILLELRAEHRVDRYHSARPQYADSVEDGVIHPVVITHPESGRKALFINEYFTTRFDGMTEEESEPLLKYLFQHSVKPDFTCRIHWEPGTLVFWDNRCTTHYATNDYPGKTRLMHRVTIDGEAPQ